MMARHFIMLGQIELSQYIDAQKSKEKFAYPGPVFQSTIRLILD